MEYDVQGYKVEPNVLWKESQSPFRRQPRVSFTGSEDKKMALHSEVQAEESHQEQEEYAERLGDHGTSTCDLDFCDSPVSPL